MAAPATEATVSDRPAARVCDQPAPRMRECGIALATLVAALHVAVLLRRVSTALPAGTCGPVAVWLWRAEVGSVAAVRREPTGEPSHPLVHVSAGRLPLTAGVAVVALTRWLHIMQISSPAGG